MPVNCLDDITTKVLFGWGIIVIGWIASHFLSSQRSDMMERKRHIQDDLQRSSESTRKVSSLISLNVNNESFHLIQAEIAAITATIDRIESEETLLDKAKIAALFPTYLAFKKHASTCADNIASGAPPLIDDIDHLHAAAIGLDTGFYGLIDDLYHKKKGLMFRMRKCVKQYF